MTAGGVGFDQHDAEADRLIGRGPDLDVLAVIFAQLGFERRGRSGAHRGGDADTFHSRRADLRLERVEIGANAGAARGAVGLIERAHAFEHRDMIAQAHVDLPRNLRGLILFARLIIEETGGGGGDGREEDDQPDEPDEQRQQPICP